MLILETWDVGSYQPIGSKHFCVTPTSHMFTAETKGMVTVFFCIINNREHLNY